MTEGSFEKSEPPSKSEVVEKSHERIAAQAHVFWRKHWDRFKARAQEFLGKSSELPPISIEIFYAPHSSVDDLEGFEKFLERADVYIPELMNWFPEDLELFRRIADGIATPDAFFRHSSYDPRIRDFLMRQLTLLAGSKKPITFIDLPHGDRLSGEKRKIGILSIEGKFPEALRAISRWLAWNADFQKKREAYMLIELRPRLIKLLREYPGLQDKKELRVLLSLGSFHTGLYHELRKGAEAVSRSFRFLPSTFEYADEGLRRAYFGKEINDRLCARILAEEVFWRVVNADYFTKVSREYLTRYARKELAKLTFDDIAEMHEELRGAESDEDFLSRARKFFAEKRIRILTEHDFLKLKSRVEKSTPGNHLETNEEKTP